MTFKPPRSYEEETEIIKRLESIDCKGMTPLEFAIHNQEIKDAYWRRRRVRYFEETGQDPPGQFLSSE